MMEENQSKKSKSIPLIVVGIVSLIIFIALLVYSELEKSKGKEIQNRYHAEIQNIKHHLNEGNCTEAALEYARAKETRDVIVKMGRYFSLNAHPKQAHAIEIAECFAKNKEFNIAAGFLDREAVEDPDSLLRASVIYRNAGDISKAQEAQSKAEKY